VILFPVIKHIDPHPPSSCYAPQHVSRLGRPWAAVVGQIHEFITAEWKPSVSRAESASGTSRSDGRTTVIP
jgi:hypothetical protein